MVIYRAFFILPIQGFIVVVKKRCVIPTFFSRTIYTPIP